MIVIMFIRFVLCFFIVTLPVHADGYFVRSEKNNTPPKASRFLETRNITTPSDSIEPENKISAVNEQIWAHYKTFDVAEKSMSSKTVEHPQTPQRPKAEQPAVYQTGIGGVIKRHMDKQTNTSPINTIRISKPKAP